MDTEKNISETMIDLVARACSVDPDIVTFDTQLDEIGLDSLSLSQIMAHMEKAFSIELWDEDIAGLADALSIGDFVDVLNTALHREAIDAPVNDTPI
jgi:acyl carrier protein